MKRKVIVLSLQSASTLYPIAGESTLDSTRNKDIEMFTGIEPGIVTVFRSKKEIGIPIANCKGILWENDNGNSMGGNREDKAQPQKSK